MLSPCKNKSEQKLKKQNPLMKKKNTKTRVFHFTTTFCLKLYYFSKTCIHPEEYEWYLSVSCRSLEHSFQIIDLGGNQNHQLSSSSFILEAWIYISKLKKSSNKRFGVDYFHCHLHRSFEKYAAGNIHEKRFIFEKRRRDYIRH